MVKPHLDLFWSSCKDEDVVGPICVEDFVFGASSAVWPCVCVSLDSHCLKCLMIGLPGLFEKRGYCISSSSWNGWFGYKGLNWQGSQLGSTWLCVSS